MRLPFFLVLAFAFCSMGCKTDSHSKTYESESLVIKQLGNKTFLHISYLQTEDYGKVACNGMIVVDNGEALVFDTPTNDTASLELIRWVEKELKSVVKAVVVSHFHEDCLGGLKEFHQNGSDSYASEMTLELARLNHYAIPKNGFIKSHSLRIGDKKVHLAHLGEGHTKDNIIGYFEGDKALFGGCLVKSVGASKGYLGDATIEDWSETVARVKKEYPEVELVIPGHGKPGGTDLLDYTIELFKQ
ncbi:subclass B1 metallo-beta-lactamase [Flagellimonas allohymeniacidonis]|uniref:beta-lactamase n=1 Tax=Flagellimonas allohymeniacidonis TaxID=2517819 RepID=A0A4Q8QHW2_9FLAO|nr:subclass B1 metallo-beta-lactamase [Allomuricauda hymeniacidonis]TAI48039.1 subclass B1 metallo-beta-lactamase [Allomuricauda hymeniacidonis]